VLDEGAMHGMFLKWLVDQGYTDVHGVDFVDMLKYGDRNSFTFTALDMNSEKMPYPDNAFDVITAWGLYEHMDNPYFLMRESHRILKDGGLLIVSWPNIEHLITRLIFLFRGEMRQYEKHNNHIAVFPKGVFQKTFGRYFDVVEKTYLPGTIQLPPYKLWRRFISPLIPAKTALTGHHTVYILKKKPFVPYA
jgi:SAM-dependent methyltransferase